MGYGIKVKNNSGSIIIDGEYKNFSVYESGNSVSLNGLATINFSSYITQIPIIAIRPDSHYVTLVGYDKSGDYWTGFKVFGYGAIDWKAFIAHPTTPASTYGLAVYNSSEELVFDAAREYLLIHSVTTGINLTPPAGWDDPGGTQTITHSGLENPFYLWGSERYRALTEDFPPRMAQIWKTGIKQASSTSVTIGWQIRAQGPGSINGGDSLVQKLLVLK